MKIAISASSADPEGAFDPRFGRAAFHMIYDNETETYEAHPNPALNASGGAGIQAAQFVAGQGAQVVISGAFGPNAAGALTAAGVALFLAPPGENRSVRDLVALYQAGELQSTSQATNPGHPDQRPGVGRGRGRTGGQ